MKFYDIFPEITPYIPEEKKTDCAVVIFAGGGYACRAPHEGKGYAEFLRDNGICAFDVAYRVAPDSFPAPLFDARYAVKWVRENAEKYGIDKNKIAVMGSSAGGHLAALVSTYTKPIGAAVVDNIEDYLPNAQILCYPVIVNSVDNNYSHSGSYKNLLGEVTPEAARDVDPVLNIDSTTPQSFIWHSVLDDCVDVQNSLDYVSKLHKENIPAELHIFPDGRHGIGLAADFPQCGQWPQLLLNWLDKIF